MEFVQGLGAHSWDDSSYSYPVGHEQRHRADVTSMWYQNEDQGPAYRQSAASAAAPMMPAAFLRVAGMMGVSR